MAETEVSKIAAEAHETFGLKIPAILDAKTDGDVAVILRKERRLLIALAYKKADNGSYVQGSDERRNLLVIADQAEKFTRDRCLQGAYDASN